MWWESDPTTPLNFQFHESCGKILHENSPKKKNLPLSPILTYRKLAHIVVGTRFMGSIVKLSRSWEKQARLEAATWNIWHIGTQYVFLKSPNKWKIHPKKNEHHWVGLAWQSAFRVHKVFNSLMNCSKTHSGPQTSCKVNQTNWQGIYVYIYTYTYTVQYILLYIYTYLYVVYIYMYTCRHTHKM